MIELKQHQAQAVDACLSLVATRGLCILEGQQRTGKTLVALSVAEGYGCRTLFLTKKKAIDGIKGDCEKLWGEVPEWLEIINYESVHKLPDNLGFGLVILDECHSSGLSGFPKPSKVWRCVNDIFRQTGAKALLMSGTVSIESKAQLFHEVQVTHRGPWLQFKSFYHWWNPRGHYKTAISGGYGHFGAVKRIGGGQEVADYAKVRDDMIERDVSALFVTVSREDAGFEVTNATEKVAKCSNKTILGLCDEIDKEGIIRVGNRTCVYESPASRLMGSHMATGGTLLDENGDGFVLPDSFNPRYKLDKIRDRAKAGLKYVIFSHYIYERSFILQELGGDATDDLEKLRRGEAQFCVLSTTSYSMGVDLSWVTGCCIMYSIPWSGAVWSQVLDRQLKFDRTREAVVGIILLDGGVDELVYETVSRKQNFNLKSYARIKNTKPNYQIP